jgi:hypothetical protein
VRIFATPFGEPTALTRFDAVLAHLLTRLPTIIPTPHVG